MNVTVRDKQFAEFGANGAHRTLLCVNENRPNTLLIVT